ncbi:ImcF-related family protein [Coxiella burnetii]|uniref:ImcF-related family protein n=1 Tax=Coxiella burnetii TaxID=777 RepID=UPI0000DAEB76|nr:ImcF-related family protein [Coxiella burnetii]ATN81543.1 hypothetical protein AYO24_01965 [Coxiella burnetii]ATN83446.1 hypothetical protein AYO23_01970 [Coxiella burnetii]POZ79751.1 hypothetical protein CbuRSA461_02075 [Coxiella burnetii]
MLNAAQTYLHELPNDTDWLSRLNRIQTALTAWKNDNLPFGEIGFNQGKNLHQQLQRTYTQLIRNNFVLFLDEIVTKQLQNNIDKNELALYRSLQTYLMLTEPSHRNDTVVKNWFSHYWKEKYPNEQQKLMSHLNYLLQLHQVSWPADENIILKTQDVLQKQSLPQLVFTMLQNQYQRAPVVFNFPGTDFSTIKIPAFYNPDRFNEIYNEQIPQLVHLLSHGDWVMGSVRKEPLTADEVKTLIKKIRKIYVKDYLSAWQTSLAQMAVKAPTTLNESLNDLKLLGDPKSALWQLLNKIANSSATQDELSHYLANNQNQDTLQKNLKSLSEFVQNIVNSTNPIKAAYDSAVNRMQHSNDDPLTAIRKVAQNAPSVINQWTTTITQNIWKIILAESRRYIDTAWASEVIPEYNDHILNRFPVFKNSLSDISINDFNHFFGPNGAVEMFFNHYLQPFVDTTQAYWTWKEVDGETLPIPQTKLDMLTRASMIQKMFYADNRKTPTLKFTLTPISLSPNVSRFALNIGGQMLAFEPGIKSPLKATWPGPDGNFVTFQFDTLSPDKPAKTLTGTWAWLRLLNLADLEATSDPKIFHLSLSLEGNTARYQLIAHSPINPYSAQLLSAFRCPNEL